MGTTAAGKGAATESGPERSTASRRRQKYPALAPRSGVPFGRLLLAVSAVLVVMAAVAGVVLVRGRGGGSSTESAAAPPTITAAPASLGETATAVPSATPATLTPTATPAPSPSPAVRMVNGLEVVDEQWTGRIAEPGGLRIRSAPRVEPGNVVGSLAAGAEVTVEGRVLNGQEAEPGKGTVWLIVGPDRYIYAAPGYVERVR